MKTTRVIHSTRGARRTRLSRCRFKGHRSHVRTTFTNNANILQRTIHESNGIDQLTDGNTKRIAPVLNLIHTFAGGTYSSPANISLIQGAPSTTSLTREAVFTLRPQSFGRCGDVLVPVIGKGSAARQLVNIDQVTKVYCLPSQRLTNAVASANGGTHLAMRPPPDVRRAAPRIEAATSQPGPAPYTQLTLPTNYPL
mgnify:CR=1 FL=1